MSEADVQNSPAIAMIVAERRRQIGEMGYSLAHDAAHDAGELARAAAWYALTPELRGVSASIIRGPTRVGQIVLDLEAILKPTGWVLRGNTDRVRELTKAGALIVAELERLVLKTPADVGEGL